VFRTVNADTFSSISGVFSDIDSLATGAIHLTAKQSGKDTVEHSQVLESPGPYIFERLLPGVYQINGFRDRDDNGAYSYGAALPWTAAERFVIYDDSITVRARWPNEGNDITLGK